MELNLQFSPFLRQPHREIVVSSVIEHRPGYIGDPLITFMTPSYMQFVLACYGYQVPAD